MMGAYRIAASAAAPALRLLLNARLRAGKEDGARLSERFGVASAPRPPGPLLWIHAASNGEARSALGLLSRLLESNPRLHVLFTTFTLTAARMLAESLPPRALHQFVPLDVPAWIDRFLDHWRPDAALWIEGELWPNLISRTAARGVPMALVNARISTRSFARWRRTGAWLQPPVDAFRVCLAQSPADATRLAALGGRSPRFLGHLKFDGAELQADARALQELRHAITGRPAWLAASTHPGEEEIIIGAHRRLAAVWPDLLTVLVPRHARRGNEVAELLERGGLSFARRSRGEMPTPRNAIYLADTMGELGVFYRLAPIAFVGASLVSKGGQNPLEAAQLGCAICFGPHMTNCRDIADALIAAGAAVEVRDPESLATRIGQMLSDGLARERAGAAAREVAATGRGATERVLEALQPILSALSAPAVIHARA
ncbi:MAG TPA: 3-deoxy-D-manno-octulosonic acid transferase [Alphaproteobacteria bacterium]|nr:3-deoxy-D-manno-octulosonic acid transferase [Alphaproteobacteria bacterium]